MRISTQLNKRAVLGAGDISERTSSGGDDGPAYMISHAAGCLLISVSEKGFSATLQSKIREVPVLPEYSWHYIQQSES
jgi:hypothetical protein